MCTRRLAEEIDGGTRSDDPVNRARLREVFLEAVRNVRSAVPLATGGACPIQAFRIGRATYATQFLPEVTLDIVRGWVRKFGTTFTKDEPRLLTDLDRQFAENFARALPQCQALVRGWMALARTA